MTEGHPKHLVPSKEELITFLETFEVSPTKRQIVQAFKIRGQAERRIIKELLRQLIKEGLYSPKMAHHYTVRGIFEVIEKTASGKLIATLLRQEGDIKKGLKPASSYEIHIPSHMRVKQTLLKGTTFYGESTDGKIVLPLKNLEIAHNTIVGLLRKSEGKWIFLPADKTVLASYDVEPAPSTLLVENAYVRVTSGLKNRSVTLVEVLGRLQDISQVVSDLHHLPQHFDALALEEAVEATIPSLEGREDVRPIALVTIDGEDSRDFDDAVWAEPDPSPENPNGWHVVVAIADVAHYVHPQSILDHEAFKRGNSVYFPDRVIPMLPESLSNGLCSLNPGEDRGCLGVHLWIDAEGKKINHRFFRGLMRSVARLTYEKVETFLKGNPNALPPVAEETIRHVYGAYLSFMKARNKRGVLNIQSSELMVNFDQEGLVKELKPRTPLVSHQIIEELMIAANVAAAETLEKLGLPCMYRVHDQPVAEKILDLKQTLRNFNVEIKGSVNSAHDFNKITHKVAGEPFSPIINDMILRTQSQAQYSPKNIGHFGLNLTHYCHFTSPIRRYADLLVHRALLLSLKCDAGALPVGVKKHYTDWGLHLSQTERRAQAAERDAMDRYISLYFSDKIGQAFEGYVSGIARAGLFVSLRIIPVSGLLPMEALVDDYYVERERPKRLEGQRTRRVFRIGDSVSVELAEVDLSKGRLRFSWIPDSIIPPKKRTPSPHTHSRKKQTHAHPAKHAKRKKSA